VYDFGWMDDSISMKETLVAEHRLPSLDGVPAALAADVLLLAIARRSPDAVIVEPDGDRHVVRCERGDGITTLATMDPAQGDAVVARLLLLADLDLAAHSSQTGRLRFRVCTDSPAAEDIDVFVMSRATASGLAVELRPLVLAKARAESEREARDETSDPRGRDSPYRLLAELGRGGMGIVYWAEHVILQKHVALKVLTPGRADDSGALTQFLVEARAACRARHSGIVDVTDFGWLPDGRAFYVMELVEGETLDAVLARTGPLMPAHAIGFARQIADVLRAAAASGIVHSDLKPGNVFVLAGDRIKVGDFGIARIVGSSAPKSGRGPGALQLFGTPAYMSPEQARGDPLDGRSDIYSLSCVLFEMLTGRMPYSGKTLMALIDQHQSAPIPPIVGPDGPLPEVLAAVVRRGMAKNREERHQTADELISDLDRAERAIARAGWRRWLPT
jgi:serine/threonine-protein kinase